MSHDSVLPRRHHDGYSTLQRTCHWLILAVAVLQLATGLATAKPAPAVPQGLPLVVMAHAIGGTLILALGIALLIAHFVRGVPASIAMPAWQRVVASIVHGLLFLALIIVPLSGMATLARGAAIAPVHRAFVMLSIGLVVFHAAAALFHHFVQQDATLTRMLGRRRASSPGQETR